MEILTVTLAAAVFFAAMGIRGIFGYLKNKKITDVEFNWKKFLVGSLNPLATIAATAALAVLIVVFLKLVGASGIPFVGDEQVSIETLLVGLFIADVGAIAAAMKEALVSFGLTDKQIAQIRETVAKVDDNNDLGVAINVADGEIVASAETITKKSAKEQLADDSVAVDHGLDVEPGKGDANTYVEPYRSAAPDTLTDPSTCYNRECVSYVACKIMQAKGAWPKRTGDMNAKNWIYRLPSWGYKQVSGPKDGGKYVGVLTSGVYGHVLWFEGGNTVSEYNYSIVHGYGMRSIDLSQYIWFEIAAPPVAVAPVSPTPTPQPSQPTQTAFKVGDIVVPTRLVSYDGVGLTQWDQTYTITELINNRAVLSARGAVWAAMNTRDIRKV